MEEKDWKKIKKIEKKRVNESISEENGGRKLEENIKENLEEKPEYGKSENNLNDEEISNGDQKSLNGRSKEKKRKKAEITIRK